jgi:hypothetical protein
VSDTIRERTVSVWPCDFSTGFRSTTTQSYATGDFLKGYERPRIGGDPCDGSFSETASLQSAGRFCAFFSGPEIPFPGNGDRERQRRLVKPPILV